MLKQQCGEEGTCLSPTACHNAVKSYAIAAHNPAWLAPPSGGGGEGVPQQDIADMFQLNMSLHLAATRCIFHGLVRQTGC